MNMQLNVSAQTIDLVVGVYLLINLVIGYQRGLFARLYDLLSTILVFVIAVNIATPLAHNIHFYSSGSDLIAGLVEPTVNYLMALVASIIVLYILKLLLGHILKPFFKHLKESSHFTSFVGGLLGMAFLCYAAALPARWCLLRAKKPATVYSLAKMNMVLCAGVSAGSSRGYPIFILVCLFLSFGQWTGRVPAVRPVQSRGLSGRTSCRSLC